MRLDETLGPAHGVYFDADSLVASKRSALQLIEVYDTPDLGLLLRLDGCNMVSERDEFLYHEALIHPAALAHPAPKRALIVGGGDGGAAEELLKHPGITACTLCEIDAEVVAVARKHLVAVHHGVFDDPRLRLCIGDARDLLAKADAAYDLVFLDLTDPVGPAAALYTADGLRRCKGTLAPGGALVTHIGSPFSHPARIRQAVTDLREVFRHVTAYFIHIPMYGALWGFAHGSDTIDLSSVGAAEFDVRRIGCNLPDIAWASGQAIAAACVLPPWVRREVG
ncbi:MAG: polyamine aminopropyltransferase [Burkholderiales bacterium]